MPKKILIISYYWPPSGGSGVQRWVYFSKYLKELGEFEPIVLTVDPKYATYPTLDKSLIEEVKDVHVVRTKTIEPFEVYKKVSGKKSTKEVPFGHVQTKSTAQKAMAFLRGNFFIPDARKYWKKYAFKAAKQIIQEEKIEQLITTGPPHSTHLAGLKIKRLFGHEIEWIVDFRDPWTEIFYNKDLYRTRWAEKKDLHLESKTLNTADKLIAISSFTAKLMKKKLRNDIPVHIIPNGYEPFDHSILNSENETFTLSYVGYLGPHHRTELLTNGIKKFVQSSKEKVTLHLAGNIDDQIIEKWRAIDGLKVIHEGFVSHSEAQKIISSSDLILISIPYSDYSLGNIPGKVFECLSTCNPIALIGEEKSDAAKMINLADNTGVFEDDQTDDFVEFLKKVKNGEVKKLQNSSKIENYTRLSLTKKLMKEVLNQ